MKILDSKGDAMLTMNARQANWKIPFGIITGEQIILDVTTAELSG